MILRKSKKKVDQLWACFVLGSNLSSDI